MDLSNLQVSHAAVHYVPTSTDEALLLTDDVVVLDTHLGGYFREKIIERLRTRGLEVVVDSTQPSNVPDAIALIITDPSKLIGQSHQIARHLKDCQSGRNSSGLLAVILGDVNGTPVVAIVKLERERGVRFVLDEINGRPVVDLELLRNLTLTDKTKVFKTALMTCPTGASANDVYGRIADDQRNATDGLRVAGFFLSTFLGCQPKVKAAKATHDFVKAANTSFNKDVLSPEKRGRYQVALVAAIQAQTADISPRAFANEHLEAVDRSPFLTRVQEAGLDPNSTFPKDLSLIKVERFRLTFRSGMVLVGAVDDLDHKVDLPEGSTSDQPVQIHDHVEKLLTGR